MDISNLCPHKDTCSRFGKIYNYLKFIISEIESHTQLGDNVRWLLVANATIEHVNEVPCSIPRLREVLLVFFIMKFTAAAR